MNGIRIVIIFFVGFFSTGTWAQWQFEIDGLIVSNSSSPSIEIVSDGSNTIGLDVRNISGDTVQWKMKMCQLTDDPNIEGSYIYFHSYNDPFGGLGVDYFSIDSSCWEVPDNFSELLAPQEAMFFQNVLSASGSGCEMYRYYIMEDNNVLDSIDVNHCTPLHVNALNSNTVKLYPNPSKGPINLTADSEIKKVELFDAIGRPVFFIRIGSQLILDQVRNGAYFVHLTYGSGGISIQTIIIEN